MSSEKPKLATGSSKASANLKTARNSRKRSARSQQSGDSAGRLGLNERSECSPVREVLLNKVTHEFPPVFDSNSKVLILGTIPSPKSRELGFYYMHPQNRFWKMLCAVLNEMVPDSAEGRRALCLKHGIALWDVLMSCEIRGAEDSSIANAVPNDLRRIIGSSKIERIFTTGKKAHALYGKFFPELPEDICLPSTSPANRTISEADMLEQYKMIADFLD